MILIKLDGLSDTEINLLRQYLPINFNSDNAAFRQRLLASLKVLLERIRDSRHENLSINQSKHFDLY